MNVFRYANVQLNLLHSGTERWVTTQPADKQVQAVQKINPNGNFPGSAKVSEVAGNVLWVAMILVLVFGIVCLVQIAGHTHRRREGGNGGAIAGLVVCIVVEAILASFTTFFNAWTLWL